MAVLLGGRAAEQLVFGHLSTGAADDLAKVTDIARSMVMRYGMDEKLGNLSFEDERPPFLPMPGVGTERRYSEDTAREIDRAVRRHRQDGVRTRDAHPHREPAGAGGRRAAAAAEGNAVGSGDRSHRALPRAAIPRVTIRCPALPWGRFARRPAAANAPARRRGRAAPAAYNDGVALTA